MKILVIVPQYAPDRGPAAPIYSNLCEDLVNAGHEVTVVCGFPHYGGSVWPQYRRRLIQRETLNGVRVVRMWLFSNRKNLLLRLLYYASLNFTLTAGAFAAGKTDLVVGVAPCLWSGLPLLTKCVLGRVPYLYSVYDIYPDIAVQLGVVSNPLLIRAVEAGEQFFYRHAKFISVLSDGMKDNLVRKEVVSEKIRVIPPCIDTEFIKPLPYDVPLRAMWQLEGKFIVLYSGNMGIPQGLDTVLRMAKILQEYSSIALVFVGDGTDKSRLQAMAKELELRNTTFFPMQERSRVPEVMALADVSLVSLSPSIVTEAVPSKMYSIMASGRPVIVTVHRNTETARTIDKAGCGLHVEPGNPEALAEAVLELYGNESVRKSMGDKGRDYVVKNYSRQIGTGLYEALIQSHSGADTSHSGGLPVERQC